MTKPFQFDSEGNVIAEKNRSDELTELMRVLVSGFERCGTKNPYLEAKLFALVGGIDVFSLSARLLSVTSSPVEIESGEKIYSSSVPCEDPTTSNSPIISRHEASHESRGNDVFTTNLMNHLRINKMWNRIGLDLRSVAVVSVTLIDLKNLSSSPMANLNRLLEVYAIVRLKSSLDTYSSSRSRTIDSTVTEPCRVDHTSSPAQWVQSSTNRTASPWGSHVAFRVPLPDEITNQSANVYTFTKGPPTTVHIDVYHKRLMIGDVYLGEAQVPLASLSPSSVLEQWLPLTRSGENHPWLLHVNTTASFLQMAAAIS
jgi:hypothetical protein